MTDIKQLAKNLRRYKRRKLIERLREAAAQRVASTAMIGADDLIAAAYALEIATAGMNAYCDELGSCRKAAGFGSADDPMAQEGVGAFSDPLCVAAFVESQFKRIVAERDALAAELKALREQDPVSPDLLESARAVVARWDAPTWKDFPATAEYIGRLRAAIAQADLDGALTAEEWVVKNVSGSPGLVRAMVIRAEVAESAIETPAKISPCAGHAVQQDADEAKICATCRFLTKNGGCQSKGTSYNCVDYCQWEANKSGGA